MIIERTTTEHLDQLIGHANEEALQVVEAAGGYEAFRARFDEALESTISLSFIAKDGAVIAIFGSMQRWEGCALCWAIVSKAAADYQFGFLKASRRGLSYIHDILQLRRFDATVDVNNTVSAKWLEWLGFKREGTLKAFGPDGADHFMYGRVWR